MLVSAVRDGRPLAGVLILGHAHLHHHVHTHAHMQAVFSSPGPTAAASRVTCPALIDATRPPMYLSRCTHGITPRQDVSRGIFCFLPRWVLLGDEDVTEFKLNIENKVPNAKFKLKICKNLLENFSKSQGAQKQLKLLLMLIHFQFFYIFYT